jgi:hypothetical protein
MADSKLVLPGDFQAGKSYLLKGETLSAWRKALERDRALPGPGLRETGTPMGRVLTAIPAASTTICPFHGYRTEPGVMRVGPGRIIAAASTGTLVSLTGLDTDIALSATLKLAITVSMDEDFAVTGAVVGELSSWPADAVTWDGTAPDEYQATAVIRLGEAATGKLPDAMPGFEFFLDDEVCHFQQLLHTHLYMALVAYDGRAALFPLAWAG